MSLSIGLSLVVCESVPRVNEVFGYRYDGYVEAYGLLET
jgi:hypothetical protein